MQVFNQNMPAASGSRAGFSGAFLEWLRSLVSLLNATTASVTSLLVRVGILETSMSAAETAIDSAEDRLAALEAATASLVSTRVDVDLCAMPCRCGSFLIDDAAITEDSTVLISQAAGPYLGKGDLTDECEMDAVSARAVAMDGRALVHWTSPEFVVGSFAFNYQVV